MEEEVAAAAATMSGLEEIAEPMAAKRQPRAQLDAQHLQKSYGPEIQRMHRAQFQQAARRSDSTTRPLCQSGDLPPSATYYKSARVVFVDPGGRRCGPTRAHSAANFWTCLYK